MTNQPPTLAEMRHTLDTRTDNLEATAVPVEDVEYVLQHYGIKGMKWGIRRSSKQLASVRNSEGDEVASLTSDSKSVRERIKSMRAGEVAVMDTDQGPLVTVKQKDGSFKEVRISVDSETVLRTVGKEPAEMSTRELNDAINRAQKVEAYNKIFNPMADPNAELKAKVEAMELQQRYSAAYAKANPSRAKRVANFVSEIQPAFSVYKQADKALNGALTKNIKSVFDALNEPATATKTSKKSPNPKAEPRSKVYNITDVGKSNDPMSPFVPSVGTRDNGS